MLCINAGKIQSLRSALESSSSVVLLTHTHPDGDALGSVSAFWHYISTVLDKKAVVLLPEGVSASLEFICRDIQSSADIAVLKECDLLLCLDFNAFSRTGLPQDAFSSLKAIKVLIDHHLNPDAGQFDVVFSETEISSASELLYWILKELAGGENSLPLRSLECLMCGMTTDTNNFANSTFPSTLQMASELLSVGVDRDAIISSIYNSYRLNRIQALSFLLDNRLVVKGALAYIVISKEDLDRFQIEEGELEGLVNIPLTAAQVKMSITAKEDGNQFRISVRSKKGWSANSLASECFHGGGHEQAAGGKILMGEDCEHIGQIPAFIERSAARFVQNSQPGQN